MLAILAYAAAMAAPPPTELESVFGFHADASGIAVQVRSNGCTGAASFAVTAERDEGTTVLTLRRTRPDFCRAFLRGGVRVNWSWSELGLAPPERVTLANPVVDP